MTGAGSGNPPSRFPATTAPPSPLTLIPCWRSLTVGRHYYGSGAVATRPEDLPHRRVGRPRRGHIRFRPPAFRVLPQRVGQHARDDVAPGTARRRGRRSQYGLYLDHDLLGTAIDTAA